MQTIIRRAIRLWVLQQELAFCKNLPCEGFPPRSIRFCGFCAPDRARVGHFESLGRIILKINRHIVKHELLTQSCQKFHNDIPRIACLKGSLHQFLQVLKGLVIHNFYFESPATSSGNLNVEPRPSVDWTSIIEPCASMICRTSESPNPVPP